MNIGAHISSAKAIEENKYVKGNTFQIFISSPQMWRSPKPREDADMLQDFDGPIYVHAPYLINVATANNKVRHPSRKLLKDTCKVAASFGAKAVIVHGGSVGEGGDIAKGYEYWRKAIQEVEDTGMRILVENTAGGKNSIAREMDSIERLWEVVGDLNVGLCLDTCHSWAGGIPTKDAVKGFKKLVKKIDLVHFNDSKDDFNSSRDRHQNLGKGNIPKEELEYVIKNCKTDIIVETPGGLDEQKKDVAWVKRKLKK
ncbi:MAG: deoxyribonuclease IV [Actinomycetota bacterium]|nr:deoxyribonuclease IV [Actinomycetota bacterium]